ncbi:4Fe-4S dicluster domain-containing protein [Pandoraea sputorum]|uniref:4Fe-4S dicluster domain-containing protein n=1 Tax=Pandoraea sputorum TaxID=93222 RepID=UPI001241CD85|nr:4Fe-4S dicluster domain-containing protein [Pandoraea sputorum]VVE58918.1 sulfite reductase subunit A [Pandoraea sputorum]
MLTEHSPIVERSIIDASTGIQAVIDVLARDGYRVLGPTLKDDAIVYGDVSRVTDLPIGWTDIQAPGRYQLKRRCDRALFGFAVGPHSWKHFLYPPNARVFSARKTRDSVTFTPVDEAPGKLALLGVRACELNAIQVHDRVLRDGPFADPSYASRRRQMFVVAVNCSHAGGTCFCVSMACGPAVEAGFDLALTELTPAFRDAILVEAGSEAGIAVLAQIARQSATQEHVAAAHAVVQQTATQMGRTMQTQGIKELLQSNPHLPRWKTVADRCLTCGNCTMVCPTCFCTTVEDHSDISGENAERIRSWDSCFTLDFSYLHGGSVRSSASSRYRQWLTHKLANWIDQFGTSGCVGCGRCITWCPVGIDITEEVAALKAEFEAASAQGDGDA